MNFKKVVKKLLINPSVRRFFSKTVFFLFKKKVLAEWPAWAGKFAGISIPSGTLINETPQVSGGSNVNIIFKLLKQTFQLEGDVVECGVFQGHTLIPIGLFLKENGFNKKVYGMDSYEGFDDSINTDDLDGNQDSEKRSGGFNQTSLQYVQSNLMNFELEVNVQLIKGYFEKTLSSIRTERFCFVHLDCDLYQSYKTCLTFFYPRMCKNGVILLDEYDDPTWPGCKKAGDEFLADKEENCIQIQEDNQIKYYIQKG